MSPSRVLVNLQVADSAFLGEYDITVDDVVKVISENASGCEIQIDVKLRDQNTYTPLRSVNGNTVAIIDATMWEVMRISFNTHTGTPQLILAGYDNG